MGASSAVALSRGAVLALAGLSLAACASVGPRYPLHGGYNGAAADNGGGSQPPSRYSGYRVGKPYEINGRWYYPAEQPGYDEIGTASWYGEQFHNHYTADGEVFDMRLPSAAHKTLPLPSLVEVTNLANGRKIVVRVNDRGPFVDGRIIDMSKEAAIELGFYGQGVTQVRVRYVGQAPDLPGGARLYQAEGRAADQAPAKPSLAQARAQPQSRAQLAAAPPVLGSEIDDRPLQASPGTMEWTAAAPPKPAPSPAQMQAATPQASPPEAPAPRPAPPSPVQTAEAEPLASPSSSDIDALLDDLAKPPPSAVAAAPSSSAVQAGAFASRANAERAAAALGGQTRIVPVEQAGRTLYKVMIIQ